MRLLIAICLFGALAYSQTPTDDNLPLTCSECAEQGFTWCAGEGSTGICFQEKDHGHRRGHEGEGEGESEGGHRHRGGRHRNRPHSLMDLVTMPVVLPNQPQPNEPSQPMPIPGQPTPTPEPDRDGRWGGGRGWDHSRRHRDGGEHRDHGRWDHRRGPPTATPTDPAQPPPTTEPAFPTEPNQGNGGSGSGDEQHGWNGRHHHRRHHDRDGRDGHADGTTGSDSSNDNESGDGEGQSHESGRDHNDRNGQPGQPGQQQPDRHHWHDGGEGEGEGERRRGGGGGGHGGWGWRHPQPPSSPPSSPPQQPQLPPSTDLPLPVAPMQPQDPPQDPSQPAQPSDPDFPVDPVTDPRVNMPIECPSGSDVSCKACVAVTGCQYCRSAQGQPKCGLLGSFECDKSASNIARINFPIIADSLCPADGMEPVVVIIVPQPPTQPVKPVQPQPPVVPPSGPRPPVMPPPPPSSPPRCAPGATLIRRAEQCANNNGGGNDDDRMGDHKRHHRHHHGSKSFFHKLGMSQTVGLLVFVFLPALVCACAMIRCLRRARRRAILQVSIHPPAAPSSSAAPTSASSSSARNGGVSLPAVSTVEVRRPLLASSEAPASEDDGVAASEDAGEGEVMPTQAVLMIRDEVVTSDMDPADMEGEMPPSEGEVSLDRPKTKRSFLSRLLPNKTKPANNYVRINE